MTGTREGGKKTATKNKANNPNFYREIGRKGGSISKGGVFGKDPEFAKMAGTLGGMKSCRGWKLLSEDGEFLWYKSTSDKYTSKMYMKKSFLSGKILYIGTEGPND